MIRAALLATLFTCAATAAAADLPKDITPEARTAVVKRHARLAADEKEKQLKNIEEAKTLIKFPATEKEGKLKLRLAQGRLDVLDKTPWLASGAPLVALGAKPNLDAGEIGYFSPLGEYVASKVADGVLIDGLFDPAGEKLLVKFLIASPFQVPKAAPKGKKNPPLFSPTDLWYVAGFTEVGRKNVPVLYAFKFTKDDFTEPK